MNRRCIPRSLTWFAFLAFLGLAAWRYAAPIASYVDIGLFDETRYLFQGRHLADTSLREVFRAPLYALWYAGLARVASDPVVLYDWNYRIQLIAVPVLVYWSLTGRTSYLWAFLLAWAVLISDLNLEPWPRVTPFAWMVLLLGLGVAWRVNRPWGRAAVLTGSAWLASYARPEGMLAAALLFLGSLWRLRTQRPSDVRAFLVTMGILVMGTFWGMGSPHTEPGRAFAAFGQHFMYRWHDEFRLPSDWSHWYPVIEEAFGPGVDSLLEALWANPRWFIRHMLANLRDHVAYTPGLVLAHTPVFLDRSRDEAWIGLGVVGAISFATLLRALHRRPQFPWMDTLGPLLLLALPAAWSILVIYPRSHYQFGFYLPLLLAWGLIVHEVWRPWRPEDLWYGRWGLGLALLLALATPPLTQRQPTPPPQETRQVIQTLRLLTKQVPSCCSLGVPDAYWHHNLETYLPKQIRPVFVDIANPDQLLRYPEVDLLLIPQGWHLLNQTRGRGHPRLFPASRVLCTTQGMWVLILQRDMPLPPSLPMRPCP